MFLTPYKKIGIINIAIAFIVYIIAIFYLTKQEMITALDAQLYQTENTNAHISLIISDIVVNNVSPSQIQQSLQKALSQTSHEYTYLTVFNWSGKIIAHPDAVKLDDDVDYYDASILKKDDSFSIEKIYSDLGNYKEDQVINISSVINTDWIIATHIKVKALQELENDILFKNIILFLIIGLIFTMLTLLSLRYLKSIFEKELEERQSEISTGVSNIASLNKNLELHQESLLQELDKVKKGMKVNIAPQSLEPKATIGTNQTESLDTDNYKSRVLTYVRNELVSLASEDIAVIYVDNTITYFLSFNGKKSTSNESLDTIYTSLNPKIFFKANRQFIVSITAIEKISKYGNSQLKLKTKPELEHEIIVGKNKAASFKKWLNI